MMRTPPPLGRPRGEIREAVSASAEQLLQQRGCITYRDAAYAARVALDDARYTVKRMAEAGELIVIGHTSVPGIRKPLNLYAKPQPEAAECGTRALQAAVRSWAEFT